MKRLDKTGTSLPSSRRHLLKMSAIAASVMVGATQAMAENHIHPRHHHDDGDNDGDDQGHHCFLKGTMIRTEAGNCKVEDLRAGDVLPSVFGGRGTIQSIRSYSLEKGGCDWDRGVLPIRIARSAISDNVPHADLYVTQRHAILIDGILVEAGNLVNGITITRHDSSDLSLLEYFHIKLEAHNVIYAADAPCETLIDLSAEIPCLPRVQYEYRRGEIKSHFRSAMARWLDRRRQSDVIRDNLDARARFL